MSMKLGLIFMAIFSCVTTAASVQVSELKVRELLPGRDVTAGYLTLKNTSQEPVSLVSVTSPGFASVELHDHVQHDGLMKMQKQSAVELPVGKEVVFQPGSLHLMLFDAQQALRIGDSISLTLHFSDGSEQNERATIVPLQVDAPKHHDHHL